MLDSLDTLIAFVLIITLVSLLITIVVQVVSAALNLRGLNVAHGLAETFHTITPGLGEKTKALSKNILTGTMISDSSFPWLPSFWRVATAVRPAEAFDALHRIAIGQKKQATEDLRQNARSLLIALGVSESALAQVKGRLDESKNAIQDLHDAFEPLVRDNPKAQAALARASGLIEAHATAAAGQIEQDAAGVATAFDVAYTKFEAWFKTGNERADQWFAMHARTITIALSIIFAFFLQLDAIETFRFVSTNRAVRDKLVAQASTFETQAAKILDDHAAVLPEAFAAWTKQQTDPAVRTLLDGIKVNATDTREMLRDRIASVLGDKPTVGAFDTAVDAAANKRIEQRKKDFETVRSGLDNTGFEIFPKKGYRWEGQEWNEHRWQHIWGMVCTAALLSLGAPFWFNLLKSLMSLRSAVAENISDEKKAANPADDNQPTTRPATIAPTPAAPGA
jgi:hypothetical protein